MSLVQTSAVSDTVGLRIIIIIAGTISHTNTQLRSDYQQEDTLTQAVFVEINISSRRWRCQHQH